MLVIPAIDLKNGRCVRLTEGREDSAKIYDLDPIEVARGYEREGARLIHIVDLDGAFMGKASANQEIIRRVQRAVSIPVEVGGGIRSLADIEVLLRDVGARHVIIGTLAIEDPAALEEAVRSFGSSIIVGIDARGREVALRGWTEAAEMDALALARRVASVGVERIIYTDIRRDGRLAGPSFDLTREIARVSGVRVTASGGVASLADIKRLRELEIDGVDSVIVGKALYEGRFSLRDATACATRE
jgi:phosphoribosylformimino-5-aminoimidazole carboxamide ribotide isomerase